MKLIIIKNIKNKITNKIAKHNLYRPLLNLNKMNKDNLS